MKKSEDGLLLQGQINELLMKQFSKAGAARKAVTKPLSSLIIYRHDLQDFSPGIIRAKVEIMHCHFEYWHR